MTTELTPCPNCGEPSNNGRTCRLCESEDAMNKALTQRPAAQTEREAFEAWYCENVNRAVLPDYLPMLETYSSATVANLFSSWKAGAAWLRASLPAPQQATPESVGEPVARVELMQTGGNAGLATRIVEIDDPLRERLRPGDVLYDRPARGVPEGFSLAQAEFNRAIDFAIKEGIGAAVFLDAWRHGDTSEWPEFTAAQAKGGE